MAEFWSPEPLFADAVVWILGGGPSLRRFDAQRLIGCRVIAVNEAAKLAPFADVLYFWDDGWFASNRAFVAHWHGLVVTASREASTQPGVRYVQLDKDVALGRGVPALRKGRSSGHQAISLAIAMGARRVVLLGFDMRLVDGRSHFHDAYRARDVEVYGEFLAAFAGWRALAQAAGVEVVNATPGSALAEFPMVDVEDELRGCGG